MKVTHRQFDLSGFQPDPAPDTLKSGAISLGCNIKPTVRGWEKSTGFAETDLQPTNETNYLMYWSPQRTDIRWFSLGQTIELVSGSGAQDVSRDTGYSPVNSLFWSGCDFNGVAVFNNEADAPQYFAADGKCKDFNNLDSNVRFRDLKPFGAFLVGVGPNLGTGFREDDVYWSHPADPGFIPPNWAYKDPASDSGIAPLPSEGYCVTSLPLGNTNVIYKSDSTWLMQLVGGQFVFRFENKFDGQGILNKYCVTAFKNMHFVVTPNDVVVHDGYTSKSIADKIVRHYLFDHINPAHFQKVFVTKNPGRSEIMICYPDLSSEDGYCNRALVWDWTTNAWEPREIPNITFAAYGYKVTGAQITWETYQTSWERGGIWQTEEDVQQFAPVMHYHSKDYDKVLSTSNSGLLIDKPIIATWEREDIVIGRVSRDGVPYQDYDQQKTIEMIHLDMDSAEEVEVWVGTKDNLEDSPTWELAGTVMPSEDKRLHCLYTASFFSIRLVSKGAYFNLRNISIFFEFAGDVW